MRLQHVSELHLARADSVQVLNAVHFHTGTFTSAPFLSMSLEPDLEQVLPSGIVLLQPGLGE